MSDYPNILTIAGSDSGGGAGIQADLKTITCLGGFGLSAITALTAQNGAEVRGIHPVPPDFVTLQLQTLKAGFAVRALKTGMLANAGIINATAGFLRDLPCPKVIDPVCVSQSGFKLLEDEAISALRERILPLADLLTPNLPEAEALSGVKIKEFKDITGAGAALLRAGAKAVLIKGGHFASGEGGNDAEFLTDWLCLPGLEPKPLRHSRVNTANNHGTGCTLSAAIATFIGLGNSLEQSVAKAQAFLGRALAASFNPGLTGVGPPNFAAGAATA